MDEVAMTLLSETRFDEQVAVAYHNLPESLQNEFVREFGCDILNSARQLLMDLEDPEVLSWAADWIEENSNMIWSDGSLWHADLRGADLTYKALEEEQATTKEPTMNTTLTACWFTPEQADAFSADAGITILLDDHDEQATYAAEEYGDGGQIAGAVTDADKADDVLRAHGLRRTSQWDTLDGYNTATVETL